MFSCGHGHGHGLDVCVCVCVRDDSFEGRIEAKDGMKEMEVVCYCRMAMLAPAIDSAAMLHPYADSRAQNRHVRCCLVYSSQRIKDRL